MTPLLLLGLVIPGLRPLYAQTSPAPAYAAAQLHCARYSESSHSEIETETARGSVEATTDRFGVWSFRARDSAGGILLESWYDSLVLRRRSPDGEVSADTDGLIGGRYRGLLSPSGDYSAIAGPFIPDEIAEVADLSVAALDLLPPLRRLTRLPDTTVAGRPILHFHLETRSDTSQAVPRGDTVPIPVRQSIVETGDVYWSLPSGLVRRTRDITIEASIPSGGRIRQPVRSRVVQRVELTRLPPQPSCR
jgi:hypothetical protein